MVDLIKRFWIVNETSKQIFVNLEMLLGDDVIAEYAFSGAWPRPETKLGGAYLFVNSYAIYSELFLEKFEGILWTNFKSI